jgi:hypothetical protein
MPDPPKGQLSEPGHLSQEVSKCLTCPFNCSSRWLKCRGSELSVKYDRSQGIPAEDHQVGPRIPPPRDVEPYDDEFQREEDQRYHENL